MSGALIALKHLDAALQRGDEEAVGLADRIGPMLWLLAGGPQLTPPDPPPALAAALEMLIEESA